MSRKIKQNKSEKKSKKGGNNSTQKIKINNSIGGAASTSTNTSTIKDPTNNDNHEYTVILLENPTTNIDINKLKDDIANNLKEATDTPPDGFEKIIKNGIHIGEEPITRGRGTTFSFSSRTNTSSKNYLGITLDLTYLKKETDIEEVDIFRICRSSILR
jgi:hypothetical protein